MRRCWCHKLKRPFRDRGGFTLVEILVSCVILSIGLLALLTALGVAHATQDNAQHLLAARAAAQSEMERVRGLPFSSMPSSSPSVTTTAVPGLPGGQMKVTISKYVYQASVTDLRQVRVEIYWESSGKLYGPGKITLESLKWERDVQGDDL